MTPEEIKRILDTTVADKMKPVIKKILEMGGGGSLPEITDPRLLAGKARSKAQTAESPHMSLAEARAQTPGWQQAVLNAAERDKKRRSKNSGPPDK